MYKMTGNSWQPLDLQFAMFFSVGLTDFPLCHQFEIEDEVRKFCHFVLLGEYSATKGW